MKRLLHRIRAAVTGYGWYTCPICGASFGGHEDRQILYVLWDATTRTTHAQPICKNRGCQATVHMIEEYARTKSVASNIEINSEVVPPPEGWDSW